MKKTIIKEICDSCGKEVKTVEIKFRNGYSSMYIQYDSIDLCFDCCRRMLNLFLKTFIQMHTWH